MIPQPVSPGKMLVDLSAVPHGVRMKMMEILQRDFDLKAKKAIEEQRRIAAEFHRNRPRSMNGIGEQTMALHPFIDSYWRRKRGNDTWADKDWTDWMRKKNPEINVKSTGTKIMAGYRAPERKPEPGIVIVSGNRRWTKSYG